MSRDSASLWVKTHRRVTFSSLQHIYSCIVPITAFNNHKVLPPSVRSHLQPQLSRRSRLSRPPFNTAAHQGHARDHSTSICTKCCQSLEINWSHTYIQYIRQRMHYQNWTLSEQRHWNGCIRTMAFCHWSHEWWSHNFNCNYMLDEEIIFHCWTLIQFFFPSSDPTSHILDVSLCYIRLYYSI